MVDNATPVFSGLLHGLEVLHILERQRGLVDPHPLPIKAYDQG
jgi:hypothetical protein